MKQVNQFHKKNILKKQKCLYKIKYMAGHTQGSDFKTVKDIYKEFLELYKQFGNVNPDKQTIITLIPSLIHFIEKNYNHLNGMSKQRIAIDILELLVNDHVDDEVIKQFLLSFIQSDACKALIASIVLIGHDTKTFIHKQVKSVGFCCKGKKKQKKTKK